MIASIDDQLVDWYQWQESLASSGIGFPGDYSFPRQCSGLPARSICPEVMVPRRLVPIDRAMRVIRPEYRPALDARYQISGNDRKRAEAAGKTIGSYRRQVDLAHAWLDGCMRSG